MRIFIEPLISLGSVLKGRTTVWAGMHPRMLIHNSELWEGCGFVYRCRSCAQSICRGPGLYGRPLIKQIHTAFEKRSLSLRSISLLLAPSPVSQNFVTTTTRSFTIHIGTLFSCLAIFFSNFFIKVEFISSKIHCFLCAVLQIWQTCAVLWPPPARSKQRTLLWAPKIAPSPYVNQPFPDSQSLSTGELVFVPMISPFPESRLNVTMQCEAFVSSFFRHRASKIHHGVVPSVVCSLLWLNEVPLHTTVYVAILHWGTLGLLPGFGNYKERY